MVDPGFSSGGRASTFKLGLYCNAFAQKICVKMKEFGPRGGARLPDAPLAPPYDLWKARKLYLLGKRI